MLDLNVEKRQPTRSTMKKRLAAISKAASTLQRALHDAPAREFLELTPPGPIPYTVPFENMLQDLVGRAERAIVSPALSMEDGKTKPGRGKAMPPGAFSAKLFCATLVAKAWTHFRGRPPGPRNQKVAAAANALWLASGGKVTERGEDPLNGWSYYSKEVQMPAIAGIREECRRHLKDAERHSAFLLGK